MFVQNFCLLSLAALAVAKTETILSVRGTDDNAVNSLYQQMGGTFELGGFGIEGFDNASISHVIFSPDKSDSILQYITANRTNQTTSLAGRGITVNDYQCTSPPEYNDRLLTTAQQKFIAGKMCTFVVNAQPAVWSVIGLTASNVYCGQNLQYICQVFFTVASAEAGVYIGPGLQANCDATYASIISRCPQAGGGEDITVSTTGSRFYAEEFATTNSGSDICDTSNSEDDCTTYTCNGNCNPGSGTPTKVKRVVETGLI